MQLLGLCKTEIVKKYGVNKVKKYGVNKVIVKDIKKLVRAFLITIRKYLYAGKRP